MHRMLIAWLRAACLALIVVIGAPLGAQETPVDYTAWESVAQRAEIAVENGRASSGALETLREQVAGWRERFLNAQQVNQARIATLQSQIAALGTPAEGEEEAPVRGAAAHRQP